MTGGHFAAAPFFMNEPIARLRRPIVNWREGGKNMKRLLVLTAIILVLAVAPASAVLRILPEEVQNRLHGLALEEYPGYEVSESWVRDFVALGREVFNIVLVKDDQSVTVHVDVPREVILGEEEYQQLVQAEADAQAENPIFTILSGAEDLDVELDDAEPIEAAPISNSNGAFIWAAGGLAVLAVVGGLALYLKRR
jgi:hypothetical protein